MSKFILKNTISYKNNKEAEIFIDGGKIVPPFSGSMKNVRIIDVCGRTVIPGLIDTHIQGAGGFDFLDGTNEAFEMISKSLAMVGVTGFLATTVMKPEKSNSHLVNMIEYYKKNSVSGARFLGVHLEGPFINPHKKGGLASDGIYFPEMRKANDILDLLGNNLKILTIAPELPNNSEIIKFLTANSVIASFGHSNADYKMTKTGFEYGISHVTHLFNAMNQIHHREPGPIPAIFEDKSIMFELISDGVHVDEGIVRMLYKTLGIDRIICITDGVQGIGLPEGQYYYNGKKYNSINGAARYEDGTLIGTTISLFEIMKRFQEFTGCSIAESVETCSLNPARLLKIDNVFGSLDVGKNADLVVMDHNRSVFMTIVNGEIVYNKEEFYA